MKKRKMNLLGGVEKIGNALPHPAALFAIIIGLIFDPDAGLYYIK